jgi:molybdopterin synthase sulfur carrier subunit
MQVRYFAYYRDFTGCRSEEFPAPTNIGTLLVSLGVRYGREMRSKLLSDDKKALGPDAIVLINGRNIAHLGELEAPLDDDDIVAIFPMVAGG